MQLLLHVTPSPLHYSTDEAVVISDYEAQADDELDLKVGDVIKAIAYVSHCAIIMHVDCMLSFL